MKSTIAVLGLSTLLFSCTNEEMDTTAPQFSSILINGEDHEAEITSGTHLQIEIAATDNEDLKQVKIDIHDAFDGHEHGKTNADWTYVNIISVSGKAQSVIDSPFVPVDATAGMYHAVFRVLDANGNEGDFIERELIVVNGSQPIITLNQPATGAGVAYALGDVLQLEGSVEDPDGLHEVHIMLRHIEGEHHHHIVNEIEIDLDGIHPTSYDLGQHSIQIPIGEEAGEYELFIVAFDEDGNQALFSGEFTVN